MTTTFTRPPTGLFTMQTIATRRAAWTLLILAISVAGIPSMLTLLYEPRQNVYHRSLRVYSYNNPKTMQEKASYETGGSSNTTTEDENHLIRQQLSVEHQLLNLGLVEVDSTRSTREENQVQVQRPPAHRKRIFVAYVPSPWEVLWRHGIAEWSEEICDALLSPNFHQREFCKHLLDESLCHGIDQTWCHVSDGNLQLFYHQHASAKRFPYLLTSDSSVVPRGLADSVPARMVPSPTVYSKFIYMDQEQLVEEYIEPLVGDLKFPLGNCFKRAVNLTNFVGHVILSPRIHQKGDHETNLWFDVGSHDWERFQHLWTPYWDEVYTSIPHDKGRVEFLQSFPKEVQPKLRRIRKKLATGLPEMIQSHRGTERNEFVLLKLDKHANQRLKVEVIEHLLQNDEPLVDELFYLDPVLYHVVTNSNGAGDDSTGLEKNSTLSFVSNHTTASTLELVYERLAKLRQKGIRAHAWV